MIPSAPYSKAKIIAHPRHAESWRIVKRFLTFLTIAMAPAVALAANGTWIDATSGGLWSTSTNWSGGIIANGTDAIADFSTLDITGADDTVHLDASRTIGSLKFGDTTPSNNWILDNNGSAGNILTLGVTVGTPTITVNNDQATISAVIAGSQGLTLNGPGTLVFSGVFSANIYSGTTAVNSGMLVLSKPAATNAIPGNLVIGLANGGSTATVQLAVSNQISDTSTVTINSGGLLSIPNGTQEYIPTLVLNGGAVSTGTTANTFLGFINNVGQVQTSGSATTSTIGGVLNLNDDSSHATMFTVTPGATSGIDLDISATVVAGSITKSGAGALRLTGANTYNGGTTVSAGALSIGGNTPVGTGPLSMANGTTLEAKTNDVSMGNAINVAGTVMLNAINHTVILNGPISGSGGLTVNGTSGGAVFFFGSAANTYSGNTTVSSGNLSLSKSVGNAIAGNLTIGDGTHTAAVLDQANEQISDSATVAINANGSLQLANGSETIGPLQLTGGSVSTTTGSTLLLSQGPNSLTTLASPVTAVLSTAVNLNGTDTFTIAQGTTPNGIDLDISGTVSNGGITKTGGGDLRLTGANTYGLGTSVNAGTLSIGGNTPVGTGPLSMANGTTLVDNSLDVMMTNAISVTGTVMLNAINHTLILKGPISGSGGLTISGTSGGAVFYFGSAANTYSGNTTVNSGNLSLNRSVGNAIVGNLTIGDGTHAAAVLDQANDQISDLGTIAINAAGSLQLGNGSQTLSEQIGPLQLSGGSVSTTTSSTLLLSQGANSLTAFASPVTAAISGVLNLNGADTFSVAQGTTATGIDLDISAMVSNGGIAKTGAGALRLSANNTFAGGVMLNAGKLIVGGTSPIGSGTLTMADGVTLQADFGGATLGNAISVSGTAVIAPLDQFMMLNGVISGSGGLSINGSGAGVLFLGGSAANNYTGATQLNSGILVLNSTAPDGAVSGNLTIGDGSHPAVVEFSANNQIADGSIVSVNSGGELLLSALGPQNDTIGGLKFTGGSVDVGGAIGGGRLTLLQATNAIVTNASPTTATILDSSGSGSVLLSNLATITVAAGTTSADIDLDFSATITSGAIVKNGPGSLRLSGNNSFMGGVTLNAGRLLVAGSSALGTGTLALAGGTIQADGGPVSLNNAVTIAAGTSYVDGPQDLALTGAVSGSGGLIKNGAGTLTLTGTNSYSGSLTIASGTVVESDGVLPATIDNQANFALSGGTFSGQLVNFGSFTYNGGTFSGQLVNQGSATFNTSSFTAGNGLVNFASLVAAKGLTLTLNGAGLDNEGSFSLAGGVLAGSGPLVNNNTLSGYGTIGGSNGFTNDAFLNVAGGNLTLTNSGSNYNYGEITLASGELLQLSAGVSLTNAGAISLKGGLVSGAGTLTIIGGSITGQGVISANVLSNVSGVIVVGNGDNLTIVHPWYNGGIVQLTSLTSNVTGGAVTNYGTIRGLGAFSCNVTNSGGVEASGGTLALAGATINTAAGTLNVDSASTLVITGGLATNAGTIVNQGGIFDNNSFALNNTGVIAGFGTFRTGLTGLTNNGGITFTGGLTTVVGPITNQNGRTITVAYNPAVFAGLVTNNGGATLDTISTTATFAGGFTNSGGSNFAKAGNGVLEEPIAPTLEAGSSLAVVGGTMRFNVVAGSAKIGAGVSVTVDSGATLELAGSMSALGDGASRANVMNNSSAPGVLVSGTDQQVGTIDGGGVTQINAGSQLTADHIIQSALVIGGAAKNPGFVTIDASYASGNLLGQSSELGVADSLSSSDPIGAGGIGSANLNSNAGADLAALSPGTSSLGNDPAPVPEPSTLVLALLAVLGVVSTQFARRNFRSQTV